MQLNLKKNFSLIFAISLPIVMIVLVAVSIYVPRFFIHPQVSFVYALSDEYYPTSESYEVVGGKLVENTTAPLKNGTVYATTTFYVYDPAKDTSKEISFADAQNLKLDPNSQSRDGFTVTYGNHDGGFFPFFFDSQTDYNARYLAGRGVSQKINLQSSGSSYYNNFRFIGWIQ